MSLIFRLAGRQIGSSFLKNEKIGLISAVRPITLKAKPAEAPPKEGHDERNMRLGRPQSPHLTIYAPQLTSMLSISHRGTGVALSGYLMALGIGGLVMPEQIPVFLSYLSCNAALLVFVKFSLSFPMTYHFFNGIRHLFWDSGKFLTIKEVYTTGYIMLALATGSAIALSAILL